MSQRINICDINDIIPHPAYARCWKEQVVIFRPLATPMNGFCHPQYRPVLRGQRALRGLIAEHPGQTVGRQPAEKQRFHA